ncbi:beta-mannosidase [Robinsoniella peoriensis]|uniref:beta-mannosidase n=1 Tax=Robinsoniella peoriensis TaxID=180332 RepID=UPI00085C6ECF|nr:sugar-binding domain-containing protein [Robinsoniella peoriensis]
MIKQSLNAQWLLQKKDSAEMFPASVPTSIYTVLAENGQIPQPYWKGNEELVRDVINDDFIYTCTFTPSKELLKEDTAILHFDGIDTLSDIYLNNVHLGQTINMHRTWEFDITSHLKKGVNQLQVILHSPLLAAEKAFEHCPTRGTEDAWDGFSHIRKAHYMYGWDWGAHLPDAGIFRDVTLLGITRARIDSMYISQKHENDKVTLKFSPTFLCADNLNNFCTLEELNTPDNPDFSYSVTVIDPDGTSLVLTENPIETEIQRPKLWYPNGLGEQPLYTVTLTLTYKGNILDQWQKRIGLRTLTMSTEADEWGNAFAHEINGIKVFAMGADYIPEEHLLGKISSEKRRQLLTDCKLANFNSIRVWGGGYYPDDEFFDLCDELGLIVWEDFMFACSVYQLTPEFEENITQEFIDNIKRIRHHACLGLWCGNNEMESFVKEGEWVSKPSEVRDYLFMYERIIPQVLKQYDPNTFYWPSSPSSGGSFDAPQDPDRGDVHFWQVWHGNKPFSEYRKYFFRYLSEFGFQAFPSVKTIQEGISDDPDDWNIFSYVMEKHQRNNGANGKIMGYLQQTYKYPYDFSSMIYASQLLQADGIRYGVEHFRRNRGRCMGAVYWQLNDCWPVTSWSSIDYYGRWKALHYYAKRFFAPVMISCEEQNWMTASADMNRQHFDFEKSIRLNVTNETALQRHVTVKWALRNADASIVKEEWQEITMAPFSAYWLDKVLLPEADVFNQYISYEAVENNEILSQGTVIFSYPKYFNYQNPNLQAAVNGNEIIVKADAYAKSVEILNKNEDLVLEDNYFDMNSGIRRVKILRGKPEELRIRSVYDIGRSCR